MKTLIHKPSKNVILGLAKLEDFFKTGSLDKSFYTSLGKGKWNLIHVEIKSSIKINSTFSDELIFDLISNFINKHEKYHLLIGFDAIYFNPDSKSLKTFNYIISQFKSLDVNIEAIAGKEDSRLKIKFSKKVEFKKLMNIIKNFFALITILNIYNLVDYKITIINKIKIDINLKDNVFEIKSNIHSSLIIKYFNGIFSINNTKPPCYISIYLDISEIIGNNFNTAERYGTLVKEHGSFNNPKIDKYQL